MAQQGSTLVLYQPQIDEWKAFKELSWRMAISLTPAGANEVVGTIELQGRTDIDNDRKMVLISNLQIEKANFPSLDPASAAKMEQLVRTYLPSSVSISLYRLVAGTRKPDSVAGVPVKNDPPAIFISDGPAILLAVDGEPSLAEVPKTRMQFVVNTTWPLFFDKTTSSYYLLIDQRWMTANRLEGPWSPTAKLPEDMSKVANDPQWTALKKVIPPRAVSDGALPRVFYSNRPAEIIVFDGKADYVPIEGTQLIYATNASGYLFYHTATKQYFYLTAGRWFRASPEGAWTYATMDLPADFAKIPSDHPASVVRASVPGTQEAKDAVLLAQIPTTMIVDPAKATANVKVRYGGNPRFEPISGTSLSYAANTQDKVIKAGEAYYLCLQGVWFMSTSPEGPWTVASSVPQAIYSIDPSSPVYNVTYVTQSTASDGTVESSYTAGYYGAFVVGVATGAVIANGSGYYYPPYIYRPRVGYPVYYPYAFTYGPYRASVTAAHYNIATGTYGVSRTVIGPYGSATRGAAYNPYTGTYARGAAVSTPYGSRSAAQAYNPYTGTYAATRQGSSPTAQWGKSVVVKGNQSAYTQHYTTAQGSVGSVQTSSGAKAVGTSTAQGNTVVGKTASGDMYAGHDGNVYKNTGSGWQTYNDGTWNSVKTPESPGAQQRAQSPQPASQVRPAQSSAASSPQLQVMQQEAQDRQRGELQNQHFEQSPGRNVGGGARRR